MNTALLARRPVFFPSDDVSSNKIVSTTAINTTTVSRGENYDSYYYYCDRRSLGHVVECAVFLCTGVKPLSVKFLVPAGM